MMIEISNCSEGYSSIKREVTKEQFIFLQEIFKDLNSSGKGWTPEINVEIIKKIKV